MPVWTCLLITYQSYSFLMFRRCLKVFLIYIICLSFFYEIPLYILNKVFTTFFYISSNTIFPLLKKWCFVLTKLSCWYHRSDRRPSSWWERSVVATADVRYFCSERTIKRCKDILILKSDCHPHIFIIYLSILWTDYILSLHLWCNFNKVLIYEMFFDCMVVLCLRIMCGELQVH